MQSKMNGCRTGQVINIKILWPHERGGESRGKTESLRSDSRHEHKKHGKKV